tara:strand:- start:12 stop:668 length:657 start_codon:yes stop_codon:yes gene_type:complete
MSKIARKPFETQGLLFFISFFKVFLSCITMKITPRKAEIIHIASQLFKEKGYSAVTVRDIADAMGIKASSLYNHIESKQEILSVLVLDLAREFTEGMQLVLQTANSPLQKIEQLIKLHIRITVNQSEALAALNNDWMHMQETEVKEFVAMREAYEEHFRSIIKEGISVGQIQARHPEVILFSILSTLRTLYLWYQKRGKLDINILERDMTAVLLRGIV